MDTEEIIAKVTEIVKTDDFAKLTKEDVEIMQKFIDIYVAQKIKMENYPGFETGSDQK